MLDAKKLATFVLDRNNVSFLAVLVLTNFLLTKNFAMLFLPDFLSANGVYKEIVH